jgi:hypothetical protein
MINVKTGQLPDKVGDVKASLRKFNMRTIHRMSGFQRKVEIDSMLRATKGQHSPAGTPPFTHPRTSKKGNTLPAFPQFIRYKIEGSELAPRSVVGQTKPSSGRRSNWTERIGHTHEFGGTTTVEKRVVYRPVRAGAEEEGTGLKGHKGLFRSKSVVLFKEGKKTFDFTIDDEKESRGKVIFRISYRATYPKRPFAAPALRKTIAAVRQGKFGQ